MIEPVTLHGIQGVDNTLSYGLINVELQRNKIYMRSDRYTGQLADIIHSGYDSAFSRIGHNLFNQKRIFAGRRKTKVVDSPVKIQFVSGSNTNPLADSSMRKFSIISPGDVETDEFSQSSNLSLHATSSLPYFDDGEVRNRIYIAPTITV